MNYLGWIWSWFFNSPSSSFIFTPCQAEYFQPFRESCLLSRSKKKKKMSKPRPQMEFQVEMAIWTWFPCVLGPCPRSRPVSTESPGCLSAPQGRAWAGHPLGPILSPHQVSQAHSDFHCGPAWRLRRAAWREAAPRHTPECSCTAPGASVPLSIKGSALWEGTSDGAALGIKIEFFLASEKVNVLYSLIWGPVSSPHVLIDGPGVDSIIRLESMYSLCFHPLSMFYVEWCIQI